MEEEGGADQNGDPNTEWVEGAADVTLPAWHPRRFCALPVEPLPTALGSVQFFLIPSLIDTIVTKHQ